MEELTKRLKADLEVIQNSFPEFDFYRALDTTLKLMEVKVINHQTKAIESMNRQIKKLNDELFKED